MASVYIGGPVTRRPRSKVPSWVSAVYQEAYRHTGELHAEVIMPEYDSRLDARAPHKFFEEIDNRISTSNVAIVIFGSGDVSAGIEAALASFRGKKVLIVAEKLEAVPRLLLGMPNVGTVAFNDKYSVSIALSAFLQENLKPGEARASASAEG